MRRISSLPVIGAVLGALLAAPAANAGSCPLVLERATRLVMITAPSMHTARATLRKFERGAPKASWVRDGTSEPAVVGAHGIGWGHPFLAYAKGHEPIKREGDKRTPAGIYNLGATFGVEKSRRPNYLRLTPGANFCVDDTRSPLYGHIVPSRTAGKNVKGMDMSESPVYRRGIFIDYPPNRLAKAGSCIFVHIWEGAGTGTAGSVGLSEPRVADLQEWTKGRHAAIAIVPDNAVTRFGGCLPAGTSVSGHAR